MDPIARAVQVMADRGEPTEHEAMFWRFEGPFTDGWAALIVWDHHDGEMVLARGGGATLDEAISAALADYDSPTTRIAADDDADAEGRYHNHEDNYRGRW